MTDTIFCKYCHHNWKPGIEYEKHIRCCEYFYQQRRAPPPPEMTETGAPIPNIRQLYRYIQDLTYRLDKTEKELKKLKVEMNARKKSEITMWLNQPNQLPTTGFEEWVREINTTETDLMNVLNGALTDGILSCLYSAIQQSSGKILPIRCFSQKPGTFYVYTEIIHDSRVTLEWRQMKCEQLSKLLNHIATSIRKYFRIWNTADEHEFNNDFMDKMPRYIKKLNTDVEKLAPNVKKYLITKIEEDVRVIMDSDFV